MRDGNRMLLKAKHLHKSPDAFNHKESHREAGMNHARTITFPLHHLKAHAKNKAKGYADKTSVYRHLNFK